MSVITNLLSALLDRPFDSDFRTQLREELISANCWDWSFLTEFVNSHPESDGPRLLAADWLEHNDDADMAGFIRTQCRLSRITDFLGGGSEGDTEVVRLSAIVRQMMFRLQPRLAEHSMLRGRPTSLGFDLESVTVAADGIALVYQRGFIGRVELPARVFLDHAAELFEQHPITSVRLTDKDPMPIPGGSWWWADSCLAPSEPACLARYVDPELYQELTRTGSRHGPIRVAVNPADLTFPTSAAARAALSAACVSHGRSLIRHRNFRPA